MIWFALGFQGLPFSCGLNDQPNSTAIRLLRPFRDPPVTATLVLFDLFERKSTDPKIPCIRIRALCEQDPLPVGLFYSSFTVPQERRPWSGFHRTQGRGKDVHCLAEDRGQRVANSTPWAPKRIEKSRKAGRGVETRV